MAKIKSIEKSEKFQELNGKMFDMRERKDCSVKAIAVVCGMSYETAHAWCKANGRKDKRGMNTLQILSTISEAGFLASRIDMNDMIAKYPGCHKNLKSITTHHFARFNEVWADGKKYLMFVKGHVLGIENGVAHDWTVGKALRAVSIYEITRGESK